MKKVFLVLFILSTLVLNSFSQEQTNLKNKLLPRFVGEWENVDSHTRGITKVIVNNGNNELSINAYGKCYPTDCDWGKVKLNEIAASVEDDKNVLPFDYCLAFWEKDYATTIMKITIETGPNPKLHIEIITIFKDNSGRSNYHSYYIMEKRL